MTRAIRTYQAQAPFNIQVFTRRSTRTFTHAIIVGTRDGQWRAVVWCVSGEHAAKRLAELTRDFPHDTVVMSPCVEV